jgi:hypothetical protein
MQGQYVSLNKEGKHNTKFITFYRDPTRNKTLNLTYSRFLSNFLIIPLIFKLPIKICVLFNYWINFAQRGPSGVADGRSAGQEILHPLWKPKERTYLLVTVGH